MPNRLQERCVNNIWRINNHFNDLMMNWFSAYALREKEIDIANYPAAMNLFNSKLVDLSFPVWSEPFCMLQPFPEEESRLLAPIRPFSDAVGFNQQRFIQKKKKKKTAGISPFTSAVCEIHLLITAGVALFYPIGACVHWNYEFTDCLQSSTGGSTWSTGDTCRRYLSRHGIRHNHRDFTRFLFLTEC